MVGPNIDNIGTGIIEKKEDKLAGFNQCEKEFFEQEEADDRIFEDERKIAEKYMREHGDDASSIIRRPIYKLDERLKVDKEVDPPHDHIYMGLGWDETKDSNRKHYRQFYNGELENDKEIFPRKSPFDTFEIKRGQSRGIKKGGLFSAFKVTHQDESGALSTE